MSHTADFKLITVKREIEGYNSDKTYSRFEFEDSETCSSIVIEIWLDGSIRDVDADIKSFQRFNSDPFIEVENCIKKVQQLEGINK